MKDEAGAEPALVGRAVECSRLRAALRETGAGRSAVLVLRGDAGIGKTALLDRTAAAATNHHVVRLRGVAAESDLAYSALHLLCSSLSDEFVRLAPHQHAALEGAIGLRAGAPADRIVIGVATLALMCQAAESQPLLCVVDDAQWVDRASAQALAFAARRLAAVPVDMPVALLLAQRPPSGRDEFLGLPRVDVAGLSQADARRLLDVARPGPLDESVADRMVAESGGNPFALLTSVRTVAPAELAGGYGVAVPRELPTGAARELLAGLPPDNRLFLVLAAAEPLGDPGRVWRAAAELAIPVGAAESLESAGLLSFGTHVAFRDGLLRPVVYGLAAAEDRRRVHRALAAATDGDGDADRRAWHNGRAATAPDQTLSDELERCADVALDRGGLAARAAFVEQAALLTPDPARRVARALDAAEVHHESGASDAAARLLAMAELGPLDPLSRARLDLLRGRVGFDATRNGTTVQRLLGAARDLEQHALDLAARAHLDVLGAAIFAGCRRGRGLAATGAQVAARRSGRSCRAADLLLEGVAAWCVDGYAASVEALKLALKAIHCGDDGDCLGMVPLACLVARELGDDDTWHALTDAALRCAQAVGARTALPYVLTQRALLEVYGGQLGAARELVAQASAITDATGAARFADAAALVIAWEGHEGSAAEEINGVRRDAEDRGEGLAVTAARYATAVLCNGLGRYGEALHAVRDTAESDELGLSGGCLAELVEAAVRCGESQTAAAAAGRLTERACLSGMDWALGVAARCQALLSGGRVAEDRYVEAIDRLGECRAATDLARARLMYGEWLRRQGRRVDARGPLRAARQAFAAMGAEAFRDRAHRELLATGERARRRVVETADQLTPQETRIALLARDGRSNPEIATRLSISPRTVEYHLHKVFTKLAVTSRTELHLVLPHIPTPQGEANHDNARILRQV